MFNTTVNNHKRKKNNTIRESCLKKIYTSHILMAFKRARDIILDIARLLLVRYNRVKKLQKKKLSFVPYLFIFTFLFTHAHTHTYRQLSLPTHVSHYTITTTLLLLLMTIRYVVKKK